jgi:hypothetical protein
MSATGIAQDTRFQHAGRGVPDDTSLEGLRVLLDRYESASDPAVQATPREYRQAIVRRLRDLLTLALGPVAEAA